MSQQRSIAIVGNPNSGKTSLFNALTGLRHKVGNYPGVTVEKIEGTLILRDDSEVRLLDLPGTYSLTAITPDEIITTTILLGQSSAEAVPDQVICVVDADNLERNLFLASQIIDTSLPLVIALTMNDLAERHGFVIDEGKLSLLLGVPVVKINILKGTGIDELKKILVSPGSPSAMEQAWMTSELLHSVVHETSEQLQRILQIPHSAAFFESTRMLSGDNSSLSAKPPLRDPPLPMIVKYQQKLIDSGIDPSTIFIEERYRWIRSISLDSIIRQKPNVHSFSEKIDRILTHRIWGYFIFLTIMGLIFQSVFAWATIPSDLILKTSASLGHWIQALMEPGDLRNLIVDGVLAGVGTVVAFLPQIALLFFFLGLLEDSGYLSRAVFILDKPMSKVGLHGRSFIPLLGSFACAVPGIMATRTIQNQQDRFATIMVAPFMNCSARLPIFVLMIGAFIPHKTYLGFLTLPGLVLIGLYVLGIGAAILIAWAMRKTILRSGSHSLIMELPPYRIPSMKSVLLQVWDRSIVFFGRAGTIILAASVIMWYLATHPNDQNATPSEQLERSYAGQAGKLIEPIIKPLGFNWKIGIGILSSFMQRELFVSTIATMYSIDTHNADAHTPTLHEKMRRDIDPVSGNPVFTTLTAVSLMIFYVLAMQCVSTIAIVKKETNSWRWPLFQIAYMTVIAYIVTFAVRIISMQYFY